MPNDPLFRSKYGPTALVAGAAFGLGAEYARQIAAHGLDLVLIDRDEGALAATGEEIRERHGVQVTPAALDLARSDIGDAVLRAVGDREIGLLVYNAAVGTVAPFLEMEARHDDATIDVNCRAPLRLVRALAPAMLARGRGGIVLMSSMSGNFGSAQLAVYSASKAFALIFADALWSELKPHGVDVLSVQPGATRTPGWLTSQEADPGPGSAGVMEPAEVVQEVLATLGHEPNLVPSEANRRGVAAMRTLARRDAIELMSAITAKLVRNDRPR